MNPLPESESGVNCWRLLKWIRYFDWHVLPISYHQLEVYLYWITAQKRSFDVFQRTLAKSGAFWERHHWNMVKQPGKAARRSELRSIRKVSFS